MVQSKGYTPSGGTGGEFAAKPSNVKSRGHLAQSSAQAAGTEAVTAKKERLPASPRDPEVAQAISAVVGYALEGQTLPLKVARKLADRTLQAEVARLAYVRIMELQQEGTPMNPLDVGDNLAILDEVVVATIKSDRS